MVSDVPRKVTSPGAPRLRRAQVPQSLPSACLCSASDAWTSSWGPPKSWGKQRETYGTFPSFPYKWNINGCFNGKIVDSWGIFQAMEIDWQSKKTGLTQQWRTIVFRFGTYHFGDFFGCASYEAPKWTVIICYNSSALLATTGRRSNNYTDILKIHLGVHEWSNDLP